MSIMGSDVFVKQYEFYLAEIESSLDKLLIKGSDNSEDPVLKAAHYSLMAGGKRIRPVLLMAAADMLSADKRIALKLACAIEMIHTYSLIHDDLPCMDDDDLRRGRPTCHIAFGEANAVLAGDALLNRAYEIIIDCIVCNNGSNELEAARIMAKSAGLSGMIAGQSIDLASEGKKISFEELVNLHEHKTGALIKAPLMAAAALSGASAEVRSSLETYAKSIGLAFQIQDDILDVTADQSKLGKTTGKDARDNKSTYVSLLGLEEARNKLAQADQQARSALSELAGMQLDTAFLTGMTDFLLSRNY